MEHMANAVFTPELERRSWLDRPVAPAAQRIAALTVNWELVAYSVIVFAAFALRIWDVGGRALHHDESLHSYYSWLFYVGRGYTYNPLMHGPFQFEVVPLFYLLFGSSEFSSRLLAVLLGTLMVPLPFFLRRYISTPGALIASFALAISPSMVYFSRFIRDDIYLACFTFICFICIVHYLERPRPALLYVASVALALAVASMEAAYITIFIFGTFLIFEWLREWIGGHGGPVISALKATSLDTWLTAVSIFVVLLVLFYSTFFTNPYGIWDPTHPLTGPASASRIDILGGLTYWRAQQGVARGGQPWFYYLLTMPLYEQIALFFGMAGIVYAAVRRTLARTFLVWWAVVTFGMYSWAGEKMPWLTVHLALPLILLAGLFVGNVLLSRKMWAIITAGVVFLLCLIVEVHSTFDLNFIDGANPTEMLIYVQTSQDVPTVANEIKSLSHRLYGGTQMPVGLDNSDVGGWPFQWYLRDFPNISETSSFGAPACNGQLCPVLVMLGPEYDPNSRYLLKHYVVQKYRWNWWFPEDYKTWFPQHWNALLDSIQGKSAPGETWLPTSTELHGVWNWLIYRTPFGERGARLMYFLVRRDLVPDSKYFSTTAPGLAASSATSASGPTLTASLSASFGASGTSLAHLNGPRDVAAAPNGKLFVADTLNHRIAEYSQSGTFIRAWGTVGTAPGQFSQRDSPQAVAIAPDGLVYAADTWNQRIEVFSQNGTFIRQWGGGAIGAANGQFYGPRSLAVARNGNVYVADTGNKRIQVFSPTGKFLFAFGSAGSQPGQFNEPSAVAISPSGEVYVADFWNQRVQVFKPDGTYLRSWAVSDWTPQSYDEPHLSVSDRTGNVFVADPAQQRLLEYTPHGKLIGALSNPVFALPIGVSVLKDGKVAVGDPTSNQVSIFSLSGKVTGSRSTIVESTATGAPQPGGAVKRVPPKKP
jgi:uncharacterized protein (TIGR03663 family)